MVQSARPLAGARLPSPVRRERRAGARCQRSGHPASGASRCLASRASGEGRCQAAGLLPRAHGGLSHQGPARGEAAYELGSPERGLRTGCYEAAADGARSEEPVHRTHPPPRPTPLRPRHAERPLAHGAQAHPAGRAGHLPGHRVLGFFARRPRQPAAGGLRRAECRLENERTAGRPDAELAGRPHQAAYPRKAAARSIRRPGPLRRGRLSPPDDRGRTGIAGHRLYQAPSHRHACRDRAASLGRASRSGGWPGLRCISLAGHVGRSASWRVAERDHRRENSHRRGSEPVVGFHGHDPLCRPEIRPAAKAIRVNEEQRNRLRSTARFWSGPGPAP